MTIVSAPRVGTKQPTEYGGELINRWGWPDVDLAALLVEEA